VIALVSIVVGFLGSIVPKLLELFSDSRDKRHELEIMDRQIEMQRIGHSQRLEAIQAQADAGELAALLEHDSSLETDSGFIQNLRASVRPALTYAFFTLFCGVKIAALVVGVRTEVPLAGLLLIVWDEYTAALFSAIISFWFGRRVFEKGRRDGL
jgi:hypothetical protein